MLPLRLVWFNNKLTEENLAKIESAYVERKTVDYFTKLVPNSDIAKENYNLSVSTYVEQEDKREVINIEELNANLAKIVANQQELRIAIDRIIKEIEG